MDEREKLARAAAQRAQNIPTMPKGGNVRTIGRVPKGAGYRVAESGVARRERLRQLVRGDVERREGGDA